jgi:hypothetical protein
MKTQYTMAEKKVKGESWGSEKAERATDDDGTIKKLTMLIAVLNIN